MKSIEIEDIKSFTTRLFAGTDFDEFLAAEAQFKTACTFSIDGHMNTGFFGGETDDPEVREGILSWKKLKPVCYEIIKGKKVPLSFQVVLKSPAGHTLRFLERSGLDTDPTRISGLFLNIHFRQGRLFCTTGCAMTSFSPDRSVENAWDDHITEFLKHLHQ